MNDAAYLPKEGIATFDAFPKTLATYKTQSSRGGLATVLVYALIAGLVWHELREYLWGDPAYTFHVDTGVASHLQINVDMSVAMPCKCALIHI